MLTCLGVHEEECVVLVLRDVKELKAVLENSRELSVLEKSNARELVTDTHLVKKSYTRHNRSVDNFL